jgi:hypothetical protein
MGTKAWQFFGAGVGIPMIGWAATEILNDDAGAAWVALFFSISLLAVCCIGLLLAWLKEARVRGGLAAFIDELEAMRGQTANPDVQCPDRSDLIGRMTRFLNKELGSAYITRINSSRAVALHYTGVPEDRQGTMQWHDTRLARLHEFIGEFEAKH